MNDDTRAYNQRVQMSAPIPLDASRGHKLHLSERKIVDGGVVVWQYRAFCTCHWSQRYSTRYRDRALKAYHIHVEQCT